MYVATIISHTGVERKPSTDIMIRVTMWNPWNGCYGPGLGSITESCLQQGYELLNTSHYLLICLHEQLSNKRGHFFSSHTKLESLNKKQYSLKILSKNVEA